MKELSGLITEDWLIETNWIWMTCLSKTANPVTKSFFKFILLFTFLSQLDVVSNDRILPYTIVGENT